MAMDLIKNTSLKSARNIGMNYTGGPSPLGYSCAGEVIAVAEEFGTLTLGLVAAADRVHGTLI
jgi:hypothetical protein